MPKNPWEWEEEDLDELIRDQVAESINLDYKRCGKLDKSDSPKTEKSILDLSVDVSAFANSAGGTIVYGILEKDTKPVSIDDGFDPRVITREWIEQVISSRIQRKIDGVRIKSIELRTSHPGMVAYVVYIPQSNRAPHQASDKKFYKRYNFMSVPMEEYEVRDVFRRQESADLRLVFSFAPDTAPKVGFNQADVFPPGQPHSQNFTLYAFITNDSSEPAEYAVINLYVDHRLKIIGPAGMELREGRVFPNVTKILRCNLLRKNWSIPVNMPIIQEVSFLLNNHPISFAIRAGHERGEHTFLIAYELKTPRAIPKLSYQVMRLKEDGLSLDGNDLSPEEADGLITA